LELQVLDAIILPLQFVIRGFYEELPLFFIISKIEVDVGGWGGTSWKRLRLSFWLQKLPV
jgi:hypothetical protein